MFSHQRLVAPSFRWLLAWAVLLVFGAGGTAYGQGGCPGAGGPPPVGGLGAGPGNTDRTFGYTGGPNFNTIQPTMLDLLNRIGVNIPAPGEIHAIAVQTFPGGDQRFVIGGNFTYRDPVSGITYRNLMRLRAQQQPNPNPPPFNYPIVDRGVVDTSFTPLPGQLIPVVNALAVDSLNRIVVGCQTPGGTTPPRHVFRLLPGGALDGGFLAPAATAAVLAVEVDPANNVYVGLNGGTIGGRQNFTRLTPAGLVDPTPAWTFTPTSFQTGVNGPVRAIKYAPNLFGTGTPGIVVGGSFTQASGSTLNLPPVDCQNVMVFATTGDADPTFLFQTTLKGFDAPVNAIAVSQLTGPGGVDDIFVGGEFANCVTFAIPPNVARPRVAKFRAGGLLPGLDTLFNPAVPSAIPNPVRALVLTAGPPNFTAGTALLHAGGQETTTAFGDVALSATTGAALGTLGTSSPFFPANPAVVRAMAANVTFLPNISPQPPGFPPPPPPAPVPGGAIFGGAFLNSTAQKLVATFNSDYTPPLTNPLSGLPTGLPGFEPLFGPTQFYASALLPDGDLLIGGDVGVDGNAALPSSPDQVEAVLYRITPCGVVNPVARFRNVPGYLVRNDIDNGNLVLPPLDINATANMGFRRIDFVDPPSIRAIAVDPQGRVYVGGQFNQVIPLGAPTPVPWNNLVRLTATGAIDPLFQVGQDDPNPPPGYTSIRKGGPTGFGALGQGFTTVDPEKIVPTTGTCAAPPPSPAPGTGEKYNPNEGRVNAIVLQPDGKVLIGGEFKCYNEVPRGGIARLLPTGALDPTFGDSSFSLPGVGDYLQCGNPLNNSSISRTAPSVRYERARVNAILLEPDGKVVVGGLFARANNVDRYNIARFNSDGTLDTGFSQGPTGSIFPTGTSGLGAAAAGSGATSNGRGGEIFALGRQSTGRIVLGGAFNRLLNPNGTGASSPASALARFLTDGRNDTSFTPVAPVGFSANPVVRALAVTSGDRILVGGPFRIGPGTPGGVEYTSNTTRARIARLASNGTFDPTFLAVPPTVGQNPPPSLLFQPGPYAVPGGSPASIFSSLNSEISYFPNLPFNLTPPFGPGFQNAAMTVNTIALDPGRRRVYIGGLFNAFESVRADFQNDGAGAPNGLGLNTRWPAVAALQSGSGCTYGLVQAFPPGSPPFQPVAFPLPSIPTPPPPSIPPVSVSLGSSTVTAAGGQVTLAVMTRSAVSLCDPQPAISTTSNFITIVGAVPRVTNAGFVDIIISATPNTTGAQRTGTVRVVVPNELLPNGIPYDLSFTQDPLPAGCSYTVTASQTSFPLAGGTGQFSITTGTGCPWSVGTLPSWISASPTSGFGNGTVNFTVAANSGAPRSATVTVAGQNFTITQAGTCTLTLGAATGTSLPVTGGTGSFTVTTSAGCTYTATSSAPWLVITGGASGGPTGTVTFSVGRNSGAARSATITVTTTGTPPQTQTVTVSQAPDSGADTVGMFRPSNGFFYLRFSNTSGNADIDFFYGTANDVPLSGDWNADGITTIGIFRNGQFFLRNTNTAGFADVPAFAIDGTQPGDIPIAGDWDGNGSTTVGLFRAGVFLLRNSNTAGPADIVFNYTLGVTDQLPLVGDWNGDGVTTVGLFRTSTAFFALRNTNSSGTPDLQFFFGNPNDVPVAGDWNGNGFTTIGVFRTGTFFLRNSNSSGPADLTVNYGVPTDRPVIGKWQ